MLVDNIPDRKGIVIAIDGPVASGKGTLAPLLAAHVQGFYLQTGAMYRCVALHCIRKQVDWSNEEAVVSELPRIRIHFAEDRVLLNEEDVTDEIRKEMVGMASSKIATMPPVRAELVVRQQKIAEAMISQGKVVIAEGRDTGTRLFPDAALKIFLTATPQIRARRRVAQLKAQGRDSNYTTVFNELVERDKQDLERETDPLVTDPEKHGYVVVDDSEQSEEETVTKILALAKEKGIV